MTVLFDPSAPKKATNLSINSSLLDQARALGINLSATLESALTAEVRRRLERDWKENNHESIEAMNRFTEEHGLFSDHFRRF